MTYNECMQGNIIINVSCNTSKTAQNLIFTQVSHFLDDTYVHVSSYAQAVYASIYTYIIIIFGKIGT